MALFKRSRPRRLVIEVGIALILAVVARIAWEEFYLPTRPLAQVGEQTLLRQDYLELVEIDLAQQFAYIQNRIKYYDQALNGQDANTQTAASMIFGSSREEAIGLRATLIQDLRTFKSAPINTGLIDQWIDQEVMLHGAARESLAVSDDEIAAVIVKSFGAPADDHGHGTEAGTAEEDDYGHAEEAAEVDPAAADTILANAYTELARTLKAEHSVGITFSQAAFIDYAKREQRVQLLTERMKAKLVPDDQAPIGLQVRAYYLLLPVTPSITETTSITDAAKLTDPAFAEVKVQADDLYRQLQDGADFLTLAHEHSANPEETVDPGWTLPDTLWPPLREAVLTQPLGDIRPPVKTPSGWYLVKVLERAERPDVLKLEETRSQRFQEWRDRQSVELGVKRF